MIVLTYLPLAIATVIALALAGVIRCDPVVRWPHEARRSLLAITVAATAIFYLNDGTYCTALSRDGQQRASVHCNSLLVHTGLVDPLVLVERMEETGPKVVLRHALDGQQGLPVRLVWHPDGRRLACVQAVHGEPSVLDVVEVPAR